MSTKHQDKLRKGDYFRKTKSSFDQSRAIEISMPQELMEQLFDSSQKLGYESPEETKYREKKDEYNKTVLRLIKTKIKYTEKQEMVLKLMFIDGLTLTETAKHLDIAIGTVQEIRDAIIKKIKKKISYNFIYEE